MKYDKMKFFQLISFIILAIIFLILMVTGKFVFLFVIVLIYLLLNIKCIIRLLDNSIIIKKIVCKLIQLLGKARGPYLNKVLIKNQYYIYCHKKLNEDNPQTFNEKINWLKLNYYNPLYEQCADKIEVREYVKSKGLEHILTKVYAIYDNVSQIDFDNLPNSYVLKTTHASGDVCVVKDKNNIDIKKIRRTLKINLKRNMYVLFGEWQYKNLKPRIMAEELIISEGELVDYKFFCYNGKVKIIYVTVGAVNRKEECSADYYDRDWNYLDIHRIGHPSLGYVTPPKKLKEMIKTAEILSKDFAHVRVDLFCNDKRIYFGELTFTTGGGYANYVEENADLFFGKYFDIDKNKSKK